MDVWNQVNLNEFVRQVFQHIGEENSRMKQADIIVMGNQVWVNPP